MEMSFIYLKEGKVIVLGYTDALVLDKKLKTEGYNHIVTINLNTWLQGIFDKGSDNKEYLQNSIQTLISELLFTGNQ